MPWSNLELIDSGEHGMAELEFVGTHGMGGKGGAEQGRGELRTARRWPGQ